MQAGAMKTRHTMVTLLDMPEILPFRFRDGGRDESYPRLFDFIDAMGEAFDEEIYYTLHTKQRG